MTLDTPSIYGMEDQTTKPLLSSTEERAFKTCRLQHHMQYGLGFERSLPNRKLTLGINVHRGLEAYYNGGSVTDMVNAMREEANAQWAAIVANPHDAHFAEASSQFEKDFELAEQMIMHYPTWAIETGIDDGWETIGVEAVGIIEIEGAAHDLPVRLDHVQRNTRNGELRVRDFKTAKYLPNDMTGYQLSEQNGNYCIASMAIWGEIPASFSYVFLRKQAPTARSKPPYYREDIIVRSKDELQKRVADFTAISNEIAEGYTVYASPDNCCGSWKNDWKAPCLLVHAGTDATEALEMTPGFERKYAYDRYEDLTNGKN